MPSSSSQRIKEIVALAKGNRAQAERLVREAIARDPQFLHALVDPFLPGIIAHALSSEIRPAVEVRAPKPLSDKNMDALLRGLQDKAGTHHAQAPAPRAAGGGHAETIRALAEAQRQRRDGK